jgi:putative membrane protein
MKFTQPLFICFFAVASVASAEGTSPTDPQIAAIVVTANQVDVDAGNFALMHAQSGEVKDFAHLMITDHSAVNKSASELAARLHLTPQVSSTSEKLQEGGKANLAVLQKASGSSFDKNYIDHEVAYHQAVLDAIDKTLIPSARNADLKALLVKVRPAFVAHLEMARQIQAKLGGK